MSVKMNDEFKSSFSGIASLNYDNRRAGLARKQRGSCKGFTLYCTNKAPEMEIYLLNMDGEVVHKWNPNIVPDFVEILPNGNLMVLGAVPSNLPMKIWRTILVELDWDGKRVWEYLNKKYRMHHDFARLINGNTLILRHEPIPYLFTIFCYFCKSITAHV